MKIVIVEDHQKIREELCTFLSRYGYETDAPDSFEDIPGHVLASGAQLVLLDINLPVCDGYYICKEIRKRSSVPIIIVTSRDSEMDELMSMNLGADDFITKPYHTQILLARIAALLKRAYTQEEETEWTRRELTYYPGQSAVSYRGKRVELSKNESRILRLLMKDGDKIHSREELMNDLWQTNEFIDDNTLTVNINRLRKKLESIGAQGFIVTKRGQGYIL